MPSLEMSLGLRLRSKINDVQKKNKIINKALLSMSIPAYIKSIKFTDTIQGLLKILEILVAYITLPRLELNVCQCKAKCHLSAKFAKQKCVNINTAISVGVIPI